MNGWTEDRRRKQSERIHEWKPWESSTGPRTTAGKAKSSVNALRGRVRPTIRAISKSLRGQKSALLELRSESENTWTYGRNFSR